MTSVIRRELLSEEVRRVRLRSISAVTLFVLANIGLGLAMSAWPVVASLHFWIVVVVAGWISFLDHRLENAVLAACYVASCDVLWRMTASGAPWEAGKYGVVAVLGISMFRHVHHPRRHWVPLIYLLLLAPGVYMSFRALGPAAGREYSVFALMGSVVLAASVVFFRQIVAEEVEVQTVLWALIAPLISIAAIAAKGTLQATDVDFHGDSTFATSGGFGPNQVSTVLGLGALICVLLTMLHGRRWPRGIEIAVGTWLLAQAMLTFSRGGVWACVVAVAVMALVWLLSPGARSGLWKWMATAALAGLIAFSWVNSFSGDAFSKRITETDSSGRGDVIAHEWSLFTEHPFWGVGVGVSPFLGGDLVEYISHTEFTRMLAEHGIWGLAALLILAGLAVQSIRRAPSRWSQMMAVGFSVWSITTMAHSATRVALTGFVFGFAHLRVREAPPERPGGKPFNRSSDRA